MLATGGAGGGDGGHRGGQQPATGAVWSRTVMTCEAMLALPQASTAVQLRVTLYWPGQEPAAVRSSKLSRGFGSQASVTDGVAKLGVAGHSIVLGSGIAANTGAV